MENNSNSNDTGKSTTPESLKKTLDQKGEYREITFAGVTLGILQGLLMTAAFVYSGLKLGFTLGGSTIAAILGFAVLKGIMKKGTIIENNINQTIASGINITGAGLIFTLPALLLMGIKFDYLTMTLAAIAGSLMGVAVIIPLRKQMIDLERLRFPSGTAVAAILKSPGAGMEKAMLLLGGCLLSAGLVMLIKKGIVPDKLEVGQWLNIPLYMQTAIGLSLMNFGAGLLSGRGGLPFALGGVLAFWVLAPIAVKTGWVDVVGKNPQDLSDFVYSTMLRPIGIGLLIGGALMGVVKAFPAVKGALKSLSQAAKSGFKSSDEIPIKYIYFGIGGSFVLLFLAATFGADKVSPMTAIIISAVGTVWLALAGLIVAECTGATDISPLSGLALIAITLMLVLTHNNVIAAVLIGVAVCVATSQCADMMQDLKTGYLVGGIPIRQQIVQIAVAWIGPIAAMATILFLWNTQGFGPGHELPAPQADALQSMIQGVVGGDVPTHRYLAGGLLGGVLSLLPVGGLGVLVGLAMYLPFYITLGYGIGCLANMGLEKIFSVRWIEEKIVPFAAGLIVGEALTELTYSILIMMKVVKL